jgi:hypothetical protein
MLKRGDKKAVAGLQLGWISVFLIGIVFVLFFLNYSSKQNKFNDQIIAAKLNSNLYSILNTIKLGDNRYDTIHLPQKTEMWFDCAANSFSIQYQEFSYPKESIVFSHSLNSQDLIVISKDWNKPFFVTNFLYIMSSNEKYFFMHPNELFRYANSLYNDMPEQIPKKIETINKLSQIKDEGYDRVVIAIFSDYGSNEIIDSLERLPDSMKASAIEFLVQKSTLRFYTKIASRWQATEEIDYYDSDTMIAALVSENADEYSCGISKAIASLKTAAKDMQSKIVALQNLHPECNYASVDARIDNLLETIEAHSIIALTGDIRGYNKNLEIKSCPLLY